MDAFQESYRRAAENAGDSAWNKMTSRQQNELIFREMRALDAERLRAEHTAGVGAEDGQSIDHELPEPA